MAAWPGMTGTVVVVRPVTPRRPTVLKSGTVVVAGDDSGTGRRRGARLPRQHAEEPAGDVATPGLDPGDELLAGEAALREAHRVIDDAGLGRDGGLGELGAHLRPAGLDAEDVQRRRPAQADAV